MTSPPRPFRSSPPADERELLARARALAGRTLGEIAAALGFSVSGASVRTKGKAGELLERALGATAGGASLPDFPHLGVELKTIPVDHRGVPLESTFVCAIALADAERAEWETSAARAKLSRVLFVPIEAPRGSSANERRILPPVLFVPTPEQAAVLRADFEDLLGLVATGGVEALDARRGRWLQIRPKADTGRARTVVIGPDGERIETVPRGFYLRARFTGAILRDPTATPGS